MIAFSRQFRDRLVFPPLTKGEGPLEDNSFAAALVFATKAERRLHLNFSATKQRADRRRQSVARGWPGRCLRKRGRSRRGSGEEDGGRRAEEKAEKEQKKFIFEGKPTFFRQPERKLRKTTSFVVPHSLFPSEQSHVSQ